MAAGHGRLAVLKLDDNTNTLQDISSYLRGIKIDQEAKVVFRTLPGLQEVHEIGQTSGTIALEGTLDPAIITQLQGMWDTNAHRDLLYNWQYGPQGSATGKTRVKGTARLSMFHMDSTLTEASLWQATLDIVNNIVTSDTWP